jgi:hypothetical protein
LRNFVDKQVKRIGNLEKDAERFVLSDWMIAEIDKAKQMCDIKIKD